MVKLTCSPLERCAEQAHSASSLSNHPWPPFLQFAALHVFLLLPLFSADEDPNVIDGEHADEQLHRLPVRHPGKAGITIPERCLCIPLSTRPIQQREVEIETRSSEITLLERSIPCLLQQSQGLFGR